MTPRLQLGGAVRASVRPGEMQSFIVELPRSVGLGSLRLRMHRKGGDPVLIASCGEWPLVDLDSEQLVQAHYCDFEAFKAEATTHEILIPSPERPRPPKSTPSIDSGAGSSIGELLRSSRRKPFSAPPSSPEILSDADGPTRWGVCVFNFPLAQYEVTSFVLEAKLEASPGIECMATRAANPPKRRSNSPWADLEAHALPPASSLQTLNLLDQTEQDRTQFAEIEAQFLALARDGDRESRRMQASHEADFGGADRNTSAEALFLPGSNSPDHLYKSPSAHQTLGLTSVMPTGTCCFTGGDRPARRIASQDAECRIHLATSCESGSHLGAGALVSASSPLSPSVPATASITTELSPSGSSQDALALRRGTQLLGDSRSRRGALLFHAFVGHSMHCWRSAYHQATALYTWRHAAGAKAAAEALAERVVQLERERIKVKTREATLALEESELEERGAQLRKRKVELDEQAEELERALVAAREAVAEGTTQLAHAHEMLLQSDALAVNSAIAEAEAAAASSVAEAKAEAAEAKREAAEAKREAAQARAAWMASEARATAAMERMQELQALSVAAAAAMAEERAIAEMGSAATARSQAAAVGESAAEVNWELEALRRLATPPLAAWGQPGESVEALQRQLAEARALADAAGSTAAVLNASLRDERTARTIKKGELADAMASAEGQERQLRAEVKALQQMLRRASGMASGGAGGGLTGVLSVSSPSPTRPTPPTPHPYVSPIPHHTGSFPLASLAQTGVGPSSVSSAIATAKVVITCLGAELAEVERNAAAVAAALRESKEHAAAATAAAELARSASDRAREELLQARETAASEAAAAAEQAATALATAQARWPSGDVRLQVLDLKRNLRIAVAERDDAEMEAAAAMEAARAFSAAHDEALLRGRMLASEVRHLEVVSAEVAAKLERTRERAVHNEAVATATRQAAEELQLECGRHLRTIDNLEGQLKQERRALEVSRAREARLALAVEKLSRDAKEYEDERYAAAERSIAAWVAAPIAGGLEAAVGALSPPLLAAPPPLQGGHRSSCLSSAQAPPPLQGGHRSSCLSSAQEVHGAVRARGAARSTSPPSSKPPHGWTEARERAAAVSLALQGSSPASQCDGGEDGGVVQHCRVVGGQLSRGDPEEGHIDKVVSNQQVEGKRSIPDDTDALVQIARAVRSLGQKIDGVASPQGVRRTGGDTGVYQGHANGRQVDSTGGRFELRALLRIERTGSPYQRECAREELSRWGEARRAEALRLERIWSVCRCSLPLTRALYRWRAAAAAIGVADPLRLDRAAWRWRATTLRLELRSAGRAISCLSEDLAAERQEASNARAVAEEAAQSAVKSSFKRWTNERDRILGESERAATAAATNAARVVERRLAAFALLTAAPVEVSLGGGRLEDTPRGRRALLQAWIQRWRAAAFGCALATAARACAKASRRTARCKAALEHAKTRRVHSVCLTARRLQMYRRLGRCFDRWAVTSLSTPPPNTQNPSLSFPLVDQLQARLLPAVDVNSGEKVSGSEHALNRRSIGVVRRRDSFSLDGSTASVAQPLPPLSCSSFVLDDPPRDPGRCAGLHGDVAPRDPRFSIGSSHHQNGLGHSGPGSTSGSIRQSPHTSPPRICSPLSSPPRFALAPAFSSTFTAPTEASVAPGAMARPTASRRDSMWSLCSAPPLTTASSCFFDANFSFGPTPYWTITGVLKASRAMENAMPLLAPNYDLRCLTSALRRWQGFVAGAAVYEALEATAIRSLRTHVGPARVRAPAAALLRALAAVDAIRAERVSRAFTIWWAIARLLQQQVEHASARRRAIEATARATAGLASYSPTTMPMPMQH